MGNLGPAKGRKCLCFCSGAGANFPSRFAWDGICQRQLSKKIYQWHLPTHMNDVGRCPPGCRESFIIDKWQGHLSEGDPARGVFSRPKAEKGTSGIRVPNQHQSKAWLKHCPVGGSSDCKGQCPTPPFCHRRCIIKGVHGDGTPLLRLYWTTLSLSLLS